MLLQHIVDEFGSTIVVGIDARDGQIALRGWEKLSNIEAIEFAQKVAEMGVERIVYTDIARDGMLTGVNLEATREIAEASGLKVTASGGVASLDDIYAAERARGLRRRQRDHRQGALRRHLHARRGARRGGRVATKSKQSSFVTHAMCHLPGADRRSVTNRSDVK